MTATLSIHRPGPGLTVQDLGRPGHCAFGLSRGGAADRLALLEAAALLGLPAPVAAIEMAAFGGRFRVTSPTRIALTGAPMRARLDGAALRWGATHLLRPDQTLDIGAATEGVYGYLTPAGGIATDPVLGSRSAHLAAGLGAAIADGDSLPIGDDPDPAAAPRLIEADDRFGGGTLRFLAGPQTGFFGEETLARFQATEFERGASGNRQGVRLDFAGAPFSAANAAGLLSDLITEGDIQMTGDGQPYVLLAECQTTGGYPRIGTVLPDDLPRVAQAAPGARLRFRLVGLEEADRMSRPETARLDDLRRRLRPLVRGARDAADLLGQQLISGVTAGDDLDG